MDVDVLEDWFDAYDVFLVMLDEEVSRDIVKDFIRQLGFTKGEITQVVSGGAMTEELKRYAIEDVTLSGSNHVDYDHFVNILESLLNEGSNVENYNRAMSIL